VNEPLRNDDVKRLVRAILKTGSVEFSGHALRALKDDNLTTVDAVNVLLGGYVEGCDLESGTWRYRVCTQFITVVVEEHLVVVTAWRN